MYVHVRTQAEQYNGLDPEYCEGSVALFIMYRAINTLNAIRITAVRIIHLVTVTYSGRQATGDHMSK